MAHEFLVRVRAGLEGLLCKELATILRPVAWLHRHAQVGDYIVSGLSIFQYSSLGNLMKNCCQILKNIEKKYKVKTIIYGHIGNGNIHVRLISKRKNTKLIKNIAIEYFNEVIKNEGTISAEHGDGLARSEFIKKQYGMTNYQTFKKIKQVLDPDFILNPGKIITKKSTVIKNLKKY